MIYSKNLPGVVYSFMLIICQNKDVGRYVENENKNKYLWKCPQGF